MHEPEQAGEHRDEERDLQRDVARVRVDADDLVLHRRRLPTSCSLELRVAHHLGVVLERVRDLLLLRPGSTVLDSAMCVNAIESVASMIAPANARPNERPNDPPAELTPAASLTRSSEIGASV